MNTINVSVPTRENMDAAMQSIGFTVDVYDEVTSDYTWDNAGGYAKLRYVTDPIVGNSNYMYYQEWFSGNPSTIRYIFTGYNTLAFKICYELLPNGGIAIGFTSSAYTPLQIAFIAPKTQEDTWAVIDCNLSLCDYSRLHFIQYGVNNNPYNTSSISPYSNDIQIIKLYNGQRFLDNVYLALISPDMDGNMNVRATVGDKEYLILGNGYPVKPTVELS